MNNKPRRIKYMNNKPRIIKKIDLSIYIDDILQLDSMQLTCEKYIKDLKYIITKEQKFKNKSPILMLSGGVDSMMLGSILKKYFNLKNSITVACVKDTNDIKISQDSASKLNIENQLIFVTFEELLDNLSLCAGKNITTVYSLVYYLMFKLCLSKTSVKDYDLVQGDGADTLLGSSKSFMYRNATFISEKYNISKDFAKTICKIDNYEKVQDPNRNYGKGAGHLFVDVAKELGANPIMAFNQPSILSWVNKLLYSFSRPDIKLLHKEVIRYLGYDASKVKRTIMQKGTGVYELMQQKLTDITKIKNPNSAVKKIVSNTSKLPI